jgi:hypothetical protein
MCRERTPQNKALLDMVQSAVERLAGDLYSKEDHFLLELIQNSDDTKYLADVVPSLDITLSDAELSFHNNEVRDERLGPGSTIDSVSRPWAVVPSWAVVYPGGLREAKRNASICCVKKTSSVHPYPLPPTPLPPTSLPQCPRSVSPTLMWKACPT